MKAPQYLAILSLFMFLGSSIICSEEVLAQSVLKDLNEKTKEDREKTKQGFKDLFGAIKSNVNKDKQKKQDEISEQKKRFAESEEKRRALILQTKANKEPLSEGIYLIDTEKQRIGYPKYFAEIKDYLEEEKFEKITPYYDRYYEGLIERYGGNQTEYLVDPTKDLLRINERGSLFLYGQDYEKSINTFGLAEDIVYKDETKKSAFKSFSSAMLSLGEVFSGNEELRPYVGDGWERVLILNLKTIAHLLKGERKAYNVTRRAIKLQNQERELFEAKLKKIIKTKKKKDKKLKKKGYAAFGVVLDDYIRKSYVVPNIKGSEVESAYVNPLGFYLAGVIQEYDTYSDPGLLSNAIISYNKADEVYGGNQFVKDIVKDLEEFGADNDSQVVHILFANGYVPEKKVIVTRFLVRDLVVPIKVPIYESIESTINHVEVHFQGSRISTLSKVADVESLCLRQQKDSEPFFQNRVRISSIRMLTGKGFSRLFGSFGQDMSRDFEKSTPDLRSWLSLPKEILAGRIKIPKNADKITLIGRDKSGKNVYSEDVMLSQDHANFVFARGLKNKVYTLSNESHWIQL